MDWVGEDTLNGRFTNPVQQLNLTEAVTFHRFLPAPTLSPFTNAHTSLCNLLA
ncbi:MAG: hypothetical protein R3E31_04395 [Chloroflexota bacterium]